MYSLLIVDDEYQTRSGLRDLIDWGALGIRVIGDAEDGEEALPMLEALAPDILLTDVRMNRMDGIALATEARRRFPEITIVFISGYSDSDYLRHALRGINRPVAKLERKRLLTVCLGKSPGGTWFFHG